jgi:hypothetical protein
LLRNEYTMTKKDSTSVKDAAIRLGLSVPSVYRLVRGGALAKAGRHITEESLAAYQADQDIARSGKPSAALRRLFAEKAAEAPGQVRFVRSKHGKVVVMDCSRIGKRPGDSRAVARIKRLYGELSREDKESFLAWLG